MCYNQKIPGDEIVKEINVKGVGEAMERSRELLHDKEGAEFIYYWM